MGKLISEGGRTATEVVDELEGDVGGVKVCVRDSGSGSGFGRG